MMEMSERNANKKYLLLDFNGKITNDLLQNEFFLRIANLHKNNPLVQINDIVFKGNYDYAIGTNIFFEMSTNTHSLNDIFEKGAPIKLYHILMESKVLNLKPVRVPPRNVALPKNKNQHVEFNLDWNYNTLLEKLENGLLKIEDITKTGINYTNEKLEAIVQDEDIETKQIQKDNHEDEQIIHEVVKSTTIEVLQVEFDKLRLLAGRPVWRQEADELIEDCEPKFKQSYEYHNIEKEILKPNDAFRKETIFNVNEDTLAECVDIDRCILYGLLIPTLENPRILTEKEKQKVLTLENFENLSLSVRYCVLVHYIANMETLLRSATNTSTKDEFDRTPSETLEIYKKLASALKSRLEGIKCSI